MADVPHFETPLAFSGGDFAVVEQNSSVEIGQCVEASLRTPVGSHLDTPDFGRPDETFQQLGANTTADAYLATIARDEPRAREIGTAEVDELVKRVDIRPEPRST